MEDNETFQKLQTKAREDKIKDGDYQERLPRVVAELFPTDWKQILLHHLSFSTLTVEENNWKTWGSWEEFGSIFAVCFSGNERTLTPNTLEIDGPF